MCIFLEFPHKNDKGVVVVVVVVVDVVVKIRVVF